MQRTEDHGERHPLLDNCNTLFQLEEDWDVQQAWVASLAGLPNVRLPRVDTLEWVLLMLVDGRILLE
jgi:hypothetical protein